VTDDPHFLVVDGRRWRREDPHIAAALAAELRSELMSARRAVRAGHGDEGAVRAARQRVQAAKVALGERGPRWWDERTDEGVRQRADAAIDALLAHRGPDRTICPSDVARVVDGAAWRTRMDAVRDVVRERARAGDVVVTQRGEPLDPTTPWKGPVRVRRSGQPCA
jgi:hypothetical protein